MASFLEKLLGGKLAERKEKKLQARRRNSLRHVMRLESLEKREVFDVGLGSADFGLIINGTDGNDKVEVKWLKNDINTIYDDQIAVYDQKGLVGKVNLYKNDFTTVNQWEPNIMKVTFNGNNGNDSFRFVGDTPHFNDPDINKWDVFDVIAFGGEGHDTLEGGDGNDILVGGSGDDILIGHKSSRDSGDFLQGDDGNDRIYADEVDENTFYKTLDVPAGRRYG